MSNNRHPREQSGWPVWSKPRASAPPKGARIGVGEKRIGGSAWGRNVSAGRRVGGSAWGRDVSAYRRIGEARIKIIARIVRVKSWWPIGNLPVHRIPEREVDSPLCEDADTPIRRPADTFPRGGRSATSRSSYPEREVDSPLAKTPIRRSADTPIRFSCRQKFNSFSGT